MNKMFILLGIIVLLICVGLSGCTQQTATQKETEDNLTFENQPPVIQECKVIYLDEEDTSVVYLFGNAIDYDGTIISYNWNISDGSTSNEQSFMHEFKESGTYYATLTVADDDGSTDIKTIEVIVKQPSD